MRLDDGEAGEGVASRANGQKHVSGRVGEWTEPPSPCRPRGILRRHEGVVGCQVGRFVGGGGVARVVVVLIAQGCVIATHSPQISGRPRAQLQAPALGAPSRRHRGRGTPLPFASLRLSFVVLRFATTAFFFEKKNNATGFHRADSRAGGVYSFVSCGFVATSISSTGCKVAEWCVVGACTDFSALSLWCARSNGLEGRSSSGHKKQNRFCLSTKKSWSVNWIFSTSTFFVVFFIGTFCRRRPS